MDNRPTTHSRRSTVPRANSAVSIFINGALVATVNTPMPAATGAGRQPPHSAGSHAYGVSRRAAGNVSAASPSITLSWIPLRPARQQLVINTTGNRVTGTAEAGGTVTITSDTGVVPGTATADGTGSFTATSRPRQTNGQPLLAFTEDKAGNTEALPPDFTTRPIRVCRKRYYNVDDGPLCRRYRQRRSLMTHNPH